MQLSSSLRNFHRAIPALALLALAGAVNANYCQQKPVNLPFARGEELLYKAEFNRGLLRGIDVGELRFNARTSGSNAAEQKLIGDAVGNGFLLRLFGSQFHLHVESVFTTDPFTVIRMTKRDEERKRVRASEATFDHQTRRAIWSDRDPNTTQPATWTTLQFTEPVQDILTVIYFLRTRPLVPGQSFDVPVVDAGRLYR